ncbi:hypothetical protein PTKIN_Ptkin19aG0135400 [Pterospermum kingtungense]
MEEDDNGPRGLSYSFRGPIDWFKMLAKETHWSFVFEVVSVYGISLGLGGALARVGTEYCMTDVQKVQPSESQVYSGITFIPWVVKPIRGLLTDFVPVRGNRRRPYFILPGLLGLVFHAFNIIAHQAASGICPVGIDSRKCWGSYCRCDGCIVQNSISDPSLAVDMQSLCTLMSAIEALVGFSIKGVFGLLTIPAALVFSIGVLLDKPHVPNFVYKEVSQKFLDAGKAMWTTLKCPEVWRPCLYMYLSFAVSLNINEGLFYWYTKGGPSFSQKTIGYIFSIGAVGAILGLYSTKTC